MPTIETGKLMSTCFLKAKASPLFQSEHVLNHCLRRAEENKYNAYITVCSEYAKNKLYQSQSKAEHPLKGIPFAVKDAFCTEGINTTMASNILKDYIPPYTATVVKKLEDSGAIMIGKTNMDEFAMGSGTIFGAFGETKNPLDETKIAGGSSGGSAAAVAEESCFFSLGTDTGGSVRLPASYCGVVGFKPSYGSCSRYGMISYGSSLDTCGIFSKTVKESAIVYNTMCGTDTNDSTTKLDVTTVDLSSLESIEKKFNKGILKNTKIGIPLEYFVDELNDDIVRVWEDTVKWLQDQTGAQIEYVSLPHTKYALSTYYVIATAEASSNLSRYDGLRYGNKVSKKQDLLSYYMQNRTEGFGKEVLRRIVSGTFALSVDKYDAFFKKAQQTRRLITNDFYQLLQDQGIKYLLTPCTPTPAIDRDSFSKMSPVEMYVNDIFTVPSSLAGIPAISVPIEINSKGIKSKIGLQLIALDEQSCLEGATVLEKVKL
nr:unnamed protein product [Naegleria fowleri]